jgi:hypothetical protein
MTDDQGVLGNLPRSRPGQRSEKRESRAERSGGGTASRAQRSGAKAAAPPAGTRPRSSARPKPAPAAASSDPVTGAIRGAAGLALTGAKVATGVTREVLRRLPRP